VSHPLTIRIDVARSRHITAFRRKAWLNQAGCYVLYWYLEFEAKRLCGEADIRGADGDEFATGKWELASCQRPHYRGHDYTFRKSDTGSIVLIGENGGMSGGLLRGAIPARTA
jgi:hypothetical protein